MKYLIIAISISIILLIIWGIGSWLVVKNIEEPAYTVVRSTPHYEVREYPPMIIAETTVNTDPEHNKRDVAQSGFMVVADYIFGNNESGASIAMTAPVLSQDAPPRGEQIAMTAPVLASESTLAFVMPSKYTLETLPKPKNTAVEIKQLPARTLAVRTFSWWATGAKIASAEEKLIQALAQDGVQTKGGPIYAGYNPPLSAPYVQRHEVMVEVR